MKTKHTKSVEIHSSEFAPTKSGFAVRSGPTKKRELNGEQQRAVEHGEGPLLIVAGAGTGKTTVVTERIKWLVGAGLAKPEEILALTFTEKAAKEMEERVDVALPYGTFGLWIMTFHSFCDRVLRDEALQVGLSPAFRLMTEAETFLLVKKNFWKFDLKYYRPSGNPYKFIEAMIQHFSRLKDEDVNPEEYLTMAEAVGEQREESREKRAKNDEESSSIEKVKWLELARAYKNYEDLKMQEGKMDFSDLIANILRLFRTRPGVLEKYRRQFKYILVDEFQDTNYSQYQLVKLLAPPEKKPNLVVVGDDSQSIYAFRGAAISNILNFMKDYEGAEKVILSVNYRSSRPILESAYQLIKRNDPYTLEAQLGISKNLECGKKIPPEKVEVVYVDRVEEEAEKVVGEIKQMIKGIVGTQEAGSGRQEGRLGSGGKRKYEYKDFAILVRANNHSEPFIRALERARIPYQFLGPGQLFRQPEIKDLIAYFKVLYDFTDSVSLYRVLSMPIWEISQRDLIFLLNQAKKQNKSLFEVLEGIYSSSASEKSTTQPDTEMQFSATPRTVMISREAQERLEQFMEMVLRHLELVPKETAGQILYYFLEDSGLLKSIVEYKSPSEERRAQNIMKFFDKLKAFETTNQEANVFAVVDYLELAMSMGESPLAAEIDWSGNNAVNILTVHSAKGLEFPVVFLVNLIEGRFPSRERKESIPIPDTAVKEILPEGDYHLQEERRLFYVGMTRAEERLILTAANYYGEGKRERKLSPFVYEALGKESIEKREEGREKKQQLPLFEWIKPQESIEKREERSEYKVDYLSYSAIENFRTCPLHYKLKNILRIPTPTSAAQAMGNSIHLTLRDFYTQLGEQREEGRGERVIRQLLEQNWIHEGYTSKKHEEEAMEKAKRFLEEYLKTDLHHQARPVLLEKPFYFWLDPTSPRQPAGLRGASNPLKIGGKIDRVDNLGEGVIEIIDYKTGANVPTQKDIDRDLQMTIYALAASDPGIGGEIGRLIGGPIKEVRMSFYYFDNASRVTTVRSALELEEAKKDLLKIRSEIEASDFTCSGSKLCENCEFKMLCGLN